MACPKRNGVLNIKRIAETLVWCLAIAWKASPFYTAVRIMSEMLRPVWTVYVALIGKSILDILAREKPCDNPYRLVFILLFSLFAVSLGNLLTSKASQYCQVVLNDMVHNEMATILMSRALESDIEFFDNPKYYDIITLANRDSQAVINVLWQMLNSIGAIATLGIVFFTVSQNNLFYGICMIIAAFPASVISARQTKRLYRLNHAQVSEGRKMDYCQRLSMDRSYAQSLRLFDAGTILKEKYKRIWENLFIERRGILKKYALLTTIAECLPEFVSAVIGIDLAFDTLSGTASIGDFSLYTGLLQQLWSSINILSSSVMVIYDNRLKLENIKALQRFQNHVMDYGTLCLTEIETIEFDSVTFTYPGASAPTLSDISFFIAYKERVALVGLNGAGKTTLVKLLLRMYDPDCGYIRINGIDIKEYKLSELRRNFSVYFQSMPNFSFTLRENFSISDPFRYHDTEHMYTALEKASCQDILCKAAKGLETSVTKLFDSDGIELSGGQAQKLSVARTFFRTHSVLILDEPSSSLDPVAESEVLNSIKELTAGVTTLFISHRLSHVTIAERIIVLEQGHIIEQGTLTDLLNLSGRFAQMFQCQKNKYEMADVTKAG